MYATWQSLCPFGTPGAQFIVPDWGDKVDYGIGLLYRPVRLHRLAGRYVNPMPQSTLSLSQGLRIWLLLFILQLYPHLWHRRLIVLFWPLPCSLFSGFYEWLLLLDSGQTLYPVFILSSWFSSKDASYVRLEFESPPPPFNREDNLCLYCWELVHSMIHLSTYFIFTLTPRETLAWSFLLQPTWENHGKSTKLSHEYRTASKMGL
jgi:hypothetical protein